ncbi:MAG: TetR/AcrR family transcriptional regulator [Chloroflexota bacterium]|jgi:AcrR family transcriptional regulator
MSAEEKIINAAMEAFQLKGIKSVTMDSIAQAAGVSKRTVYELFEDKDALAIATIKRMILDNNRKLIELLGHTENVIEALFIAMDTESNRRTKLSPVFEADLSKYHDIIMAEFLEHPEKLCDYSAGFTFLQKGIEQGVIRKEMRIEIVDSFLHDMIGLVHHSKRIKQIKPTKEEVINNIFLPYFRGICTRKGLTLMEKYFENLSE